LRKILKTAPTRRYDHAARIVTFSLMALQWAAIRPRAYGDSRPEAALIEKSVYAT